jgi:hypothetical protein
VHVVRQGRRGAVIRVWAVSERTAVRLTVRRGDTVRRISRSLRKGQSVSLRTRLRPARVTVTGRDGAGNVATMRRALR